MSGISAGTGTREQYERLMELDRTLRTARPAAPRGREVSLFDSGPATATAPPVSVTSGSSENAVSASPRQAFRRASFWIVFGAIAIVVGIVSTIAAGGVTPTDRFGADNAGPTGGRALAEVLKQQGVDRDGGQLGRARSPSSRADPSDTTLLIYDSRRLPHRAVRGRAAGRRGSDRARRADRGSARPLRAGCRDGRVAGRRERHDLAGRGLLGARGAARGQRHGGHDERAAPERLRLWTPRPWRRSGTEFCFPDDSGRYLLAQRTDGSTTVTVLPDSEPFTQRPDHPFRQRGPGSQSARRDGDLIWYLPGLGDLTGGADVPSVADLTPEWVTPVLLLLIVVFVAAAVWRGRRLGPLVIENLPVVVRSRETMEGRARLYQRSSSRGSSARQSAHRHDRPDGHHAQPLAHVVASMRSSMRPPHCSASPRRACAPCCATSSRRPTPTSSG